MIDGKKILGLIPARGGSKGIPRKNIIEVAGKPLIFYTIDVAKKSKYLDKIVVSSEDDEILEISQKLGADILRRPMELALDDTPGIEPVLHALECLPGFDYVVMLQPTSPLRISDDIDGAIEQCIREAASSCVSVRLVNESPYWMFNFSERKKLIPLLDFSLPTRRQDLPTAYILNGSIYVAETIWIKVSRTFVDKNTLGYLMPYNRSLDVDTIEDLKQLESIPRLKT